MKNNEWFEKVQNALPGHGTSLHKRVELFERLGRIVPETVWNQLSLVDTSGSVSLFAKAGGFAHVICNTPTYRSRLIAEALVANTHMQLGKSDCRKLLRRPKKPLNRFILQEFSQCFWQDYGLLLARVQTSSDLLADPRKQALAKLLLWHLIFDLMTVPSVMDIKGRPFAGELSKAPDWFPTCPTTLLFEILGGHIGIGDERDLVWYEVEMINEAVFDSGTKVEICQESTKDLTGALGGDVLHFELMSPVSPWHRALDQALDSMLQGAVAESSPVSSEVGVGKDELAEVLRQGDHFPVWLMSGEAKRNDIQSWLAVVKQVAPERYVKGWYNDGPFILAVDESALAKRLK